MRARVASDLDALRSQYLPELGPTVAHAGTDYPYRARVARNALAGVAAGLVQDIGYSNFKDEVRKRQASAREHAYHRVWEALHGLEKKAAPPVPAPKSDARKTAKRPAGKKQSFGGVVVDDRGRVLLRRPRGGYGGYAWTFGKGEADRGESPEEPALREVREETGCIATIVAPIPGTFDGTTSTNTCWLMRPTGVTHPFDASETEAVEWFTWAEAARRIATTPTVKGRDRALAVLAAAKKALASR